MFFTAAYDEMAIQIAVYVIEHRNKIIKIGKENVLKINFVRIVMARFMEMFLIFG